MNGARYAIVVGCLLCLAGAGGCSQATPARPVVGTQQPGALPKSAEGIAFIRDGDAFVIRDGSEREVLPSDFTKVAAGYSADRKNLLVTEERGNRRVVLMVPADGGAPGSIVLDSAQGSSLGTVRMAGKPQLVYFSVYGDPTGHLAASVAGKVSEPTTIALGSAFSAEFDVGASGDSLVYTGSGQNPATVMIRAGSSERPLVAGFATAFAPAFSLDGARVCFTGSERADARISVWVVDTDSDTPQAVPGTDQLAPTYPVFSPGADRIAVRGGEDGAIWIVPAAGGEPEKLDVNCDEAPIGW